MAQSFVRVDVRGMQGLFLYLKKVQTNTKKEGMELTRKMAEMIARKARTLVAPLHTGTGNLKQSIRALPMKNGWYATAGEGTLNLRGINYAIFQELGFTPHWIHKQMVDSKIRNKFKGRFAYVSKFTPFMTPAYKYVLNRMDTELNRTANQIIRG